VSDKLLTTAQAAQRLGVSQVTINKWIDLGHFPNAYKLSSARGRLRGKTKSRSGLKQNAASHWPANGVMSAPSLVPIDLHLTN
jgi:excisionase family DNA binding protein